MNPNAELSFPSPIDCKNTLTFLEEGNSNLSATSGAVYITKYISLEDFLFFHPPNILIGKYE